MQVTETLSDGLKRELKVVIGQGELGERLVSRLDEVKGQLQIKGFRKGKVPVAHIKKVFGRSLMAEVLEKAVQETSEKALTDRNERPAFQPSIAFTDGDNKEHMEKVIAGQSDLAYTMSFEVLPEIAITDLSALALERESCDVSEEAIDKAVEQLAERAVRYETEEGRAASDGDRVTIDYVGRIDGAEFEGGKGEGAEIVLGQGGFIPGFEDGLKGAKAGESRQVEAQFPDAYQEKDLAGKKAVFETTIRVVARPIRPAIDDEFAKSLNAESLARLRELIKDEIAREYAQVARSKLKRHLLDALDKTHHFALPQQLVDSEFENMWRQVTGDLERAKRTFADEGRTEEDARAEYRKLAERRVRLGLLIGEIGNKNKIEVTQEEMRRALIEQARSMPGREKFVYEFYEKNPGALNSLRAPIFEDKVVDHILGLANVSEKKVSREELLKPLEGDTPPPGAQHDHAHDDHHHHHDHDHHGHDHGHEHHGHGHHHDHEHGKQ